MNRRKPVRGSIILAGLVGSVLIGNAPALISEANADALCEHRTASHVAEHGGIDADSAWHVSHGELPTCKPAEKTYVPPPSNDDQGDKSRYCERRWFC